MSEKFATRADASMRLDNTLCRYKGVPVHVHVHPEGHKTDDEVKICYLLDKTEGVAKYTDPQFDYSSPPLGYMYWKGRAIYVSRLPQRRQAQGLRNGAIDLNPPDAGGQYFISPAMHSCIMGEHESPEDALFRIRSGRDNGVPFHRWLAFIRDNKRNQIELHYRGRPVGYWDMKHKKITLNQSRETTVIENILRRLGMEV